MPAYEKTAKSYWGWNDDGGHRPWYQEWLDPTLSSTTAKAPTGGASPFIDTMDRWYNPWSKQQQSTERGEAYLRVPGQIAAGTALAAGAGAGALAAAPAVGSGATALYNTAAGGLAAAGAGVQQQLSRVGPAVSSLTARAAKPVNFVRNTFKPGFRELRQALRETPRIYAAEPARPITETMRRALNQFNGISRYGRMTPEQIRAYRGRAAGTREPGFSGVYDSLQNTATSFLPKNTVDIYGTRNAVMRHELLHGAQNVGARLREVAGNPVTPTRSLQTLSGRLLNRGQAPGTWRHAAGEFLGELNAYAGQNRGPLRQIIGGTNFLFSPQMAQRYSAAYGGKYPFIHGAVTLAPWLAGQQAALNLLRKKSPQPDTNQNANR